METIYARTVGYRQVGAECRPITDEIHRRAPGEWVVFYAYCPGFPFQRDVVKTRRAAFTLLGVEVGR